MRDFQSASPGRLRVLSAGAKILYSAFIVATIAGLLVSWRLYGAAIGDAGAAAYYAGAPAAATAPIPSSQLPNPVGGGPAIDLSPEDARPRVIMEQMPERKLLEVTHFHLFSVPVYVLILAHLWLLAKIPAWLQSGGVIAAVATTAIHLAAPWIVRGRPGAAMLMGSSGAAMLLVLGVMGLWSMVDMWLPTGRGDDVRKKRASDRPGSPA